MMPATIAVVFPFTTVLVYEREAAKMGAMNVELSVAGVWPWRNWELLTEPVLLLKVIDALEGLQVP